MLQVLWSVVLLRVSLYSSNVTISADLPERPPRGSTAVTSMYSMRQIPYRIEILFPYPYIKILPRYLQGANNIPIKRKICKIGTGSAVFLPKSWIDQIEEKHVPLKAVTIEVDDALTIKPIIKENST